MMNKQGAPVMERSYHIPLPMFDSAFRAFQKKYVFPRNLIITVILLAIAGVYVHAITKDSSNTMAYLLCVACIAIILITWYNPLKLRRAVHDALKDIEQDRYTLSVYKEGLVIRTEDAAPAPQETEPAPQETKPEPEQAPEQDTGNGFTDIFPEEPAEPAEPVAPTEIPFGPDVKIHEFEDYFMVYLVKQNFYVIPKKDFSEAEISQLRELFTA